MKDKLTGFYLDPTLITTIYGLYIHPLMHPSQQTKTLVYSKAQCKLWDYIRAASQKLMQFLQIHTCNWYKIAIAAYSMQYAVRMILN